MILICYILSIVFGAAGDALDHIGKKQVGHIAQGLEILMLITLFVLALVARPDYTPGQITGVALSYFALRFWLFDYVWNIAAGQSLFYIGNTSIYDKFLRKIHPAMVQMMKWTVGVLAVVFLLI
jgi:hypothetical protein